MASADTTFCLGGYVCLNYLKRCLPELAEATFATTASDARNAGGEACTPAMSDTLKKETAKVELTAACPAHAAVVAYHQGTELA